MNNQEKSTAGFLTFLGFFGGLLIGPSYAWLGLALPIGYVITKRKSSSE